MSFNSFKFNNDQVFNNKIKTKFTQTNILIIYRHNYLIFK